VAPERLLSKGADANLCCTMGRTPLLYALIRVVSIHHFMCSRRENDSSIQAREMQLSKAYYVFKYLIECSSVGIKDINGQTAFHMIAKKGLSPLIQLAIKEGAAIDARDKIPFRIP
jgi:ankyrin repeat protein